MNFFQHQDDARKKTAQLIGLLIAAVTCLIIITAVFLAAFIYYFQAHATSVDAVAAYNTSFAQHLLTVATSATMLWIVLGVCVVVAWGSLFKAAELKKGGAYIAESLGGRPLIHESTDHDERRLLNVVEEMAIASGVPVPRVYLMEDNAINAFAAGTEYSNAVIGITRGCIKNLTRDQLQGVIAHEFSHIYHGDMRLNMRLVSMLHGILLIGLIGNVILSSTMHHGHGGYGRSRRGKGNQLAVLGFGLVAIGFSGTFFGNIIKSAVSRQREFLADASAVQFTRNPLGIAGALFQINRYSQGSVLHASSAAEFSHFFFARGIKSFFSSMFSTHPPLNERIERIMPNGKQLLESQVKTRSDEPEYNQNEPPSSDASVAPYASNFAGAGIGSTSTTANEAKANIATCISSIGNVGPRSLAASHYLLASIPNAIHAACQTPYQARAVFYVLLLSSEPTTKKNQIAYLQARANPVTFKEFVDLNVRMAGLDRSVRLPLMQLCLPSLLNLSEPQQRLFKTNLLALIKSDNAVSLFEWSALKLVTNAFDTQLKAANLSLNALKVDIETIAGFVSLLGNAGHQQAGFEAALKQLWPNYDGKYAPSRNLSQLDKAVSHLRRLKPLQKPQLLKALATVCLADGELNTREEEILRVIAAILDCPLPLAAHE